MIPFYLGCAVVTHVIIATQVMCTCVGEGAGWKLEYVRIAYYTLLLFQHVCIFWIGLKMGFFFLVDSDYSSFHKKYVMYLISTKSIKEWEEGKAEKNKIKLRPAKREKVKWTKRKK